MARNKSGQINRRVSRWAATGRRRPPRIRRAARLRRERLGAVQRDGQLADHWQTGVVLRQAVDPGLEHVGVEHADVRPPFGGHVAQGDVSVAPVGSEAQHEQRVGARRFQRHPQPGLGVETLKARGAVAVRCRAVEVEAQPAGEYSN